MPTFQEIYSRYNTARENKLISPDESIADYAKRALAFTGDPSYRSVAEGGTIGNFVRSRSADLTNFVNSGPVDEWLGQGTQWIGDKFGVDPEVSRGVGESLPRMAVDFLPMAAGAALAPYTGGASLSIAGAGLAGTSALSAANAYEQSGKVSDAIIGGVSPYVGSKLSEIGGRAALNLVPKSNILKSLGFTGGTAVENAALDTAERAALMARQGVTQEVANAATKSFTRLDKPLDKVLHYAGGEALANVGFTGLDIVQQGKDAVFNRDYLFANLVSNVPFAAADLAGSFAHRQLGETKFNLPEAPKIFRSPGEERAIYAAAMFEDFKDPKAAMEYRRKYGLDISDTIIRTHELAAALNAKEEGLRVNEADFVAKWNNYLESDPLAFQAGLKPIQRGGAFGQELIGLQEAIKGKKPMPEAEKLVKEFRDKNQRLHASVGQVVSNLGKPVNTVDSLKLGVMKLGLDEFLQTPVEQRDYAKALDGTFLSLDGVDLIRDIHRKDAGLEPLRPDLYQEFVNLAIGKPRTFTPDKHLELLVAASLARGETPKMVKAKKRGTTAQQEGQKADVVVEETLKGFQEENKNILEKFRQPVIPDDLQSGLLDLGQPTGDVTQGLGQRQRVQPAEFQSGLGDLGTTQGDLLSQVPQVQPTPESVPTTQLDQLIQGMPAKWPQDVKDIVAEFYRTGDSKVLYKIEGPNRLVRKQFAEKALREADPEYDQRTAEWEKKEAAKTKTLNTLPDRSLDADDLELDVLDSNQIELEQLPEESFLRAEDWSKVKDQTGRVNLVPRPEGEFQAVQAFAKSLMSKLVPKEEVDARWGEMIQLAKMFNNPEVAYAELGKMVRGQGDAQFARASAGAFDFGMREVQDGKLVRPGKPPLGTKDGWMTELEFRVNGGDLGPLQKDEVEFYKQLVPEAFGKNSKGEDAVHLQKLWDGLGKVGEQVKVVVYGQANEANTTAESLARSQLRDQASHMLETLGYRLDEDNLWVKNGKDVFDVNEPNAVNWANIFYDNEETSSPGDGLKPYEATGPRATSYYNTISPFDTKKFPVVRVDVVLPEGGSGKEYTLAPRSDGQFVAMKNGMASSPYFKDRAHGEAWIKQNERPLWSPDNLHENLPNTLGWAMVQIVPHPVTGEKVMFVGEAQSRWGQAVQAQKVTAKKWPVITDVNKLPEGYQWVQTSWANEWVLYRDSTAVSDAFPTKEQALSDPDEGYAGYRGEVLDRLSSDHPLLPIHQNLILKSVIKEAQKQGISKVAVSDGETAMMTEGHDKAAERTYQESDIGKWSVRDSVTNREYNLYPTQANAELQAKDIQARTGNPQVLKEITKEDTALRVSQEGGMRLAYDTTMPSIMSKLVGEGKMEDFGVHKNAERGAFEQNPPSNDPNILAGESWNPDAVKGSPVFRTPVQPNTNVEFKDQFGNRALLTKNTRPGEEPWRVSYIDKDGEPHQHHTYNTWEEAMQNAKSDYSFGDDSEMRQVTSGTPKTNATARVYDITSPSPRASTLFAQNQGKIYGAASYQARKIFMNSKAFQGKSSVERLRFVFAHENSHISFAKAINGEYGPNAKALADSAQQWVNQADPQAKKNVEDVIRELHLDPELANMDGIRDVLNNPDPQEWLANVWAMYAMGALKPKSTKESYAFLPKSIRDFVDWAVSGLQSLAKGAQTWLRLSGGNYKAAKDMKDLFNEVRRSFRQAEWDAAQAREFLDLDAASRIEKMNDLAFAQSGEDKLGQVGEQPFKDNPARWFGNAWNKTIQPIHTLANTHKEFVEPVMAVMNSPSETSEVIADVFKVVVGEYDGKDKVRINNQAFARVKGSEALNRLANAIITRSQVVKQRMLKLKDSSLAEGELKEELDFDALSPELRGRIKQFTPEAQQALVTYIAQSERANILLQKKIMEAEGQKMTNNLATLLITKGSFNKADFSKAPEIAKGLVADLQMGDVMNAQSKLVGLDESDQAKMMQQAQELVASHVKLQKYYDEHPTYMSFRRFGKITQRIKKAGQPDDVIDADTELELKELLKYYKEQGWEEYGDYKTREVKKGQSYALDSELLTIMQQREKMFKEMIDNSQSLTPAEKTEILSQPTASEAMISEINSRELYKPTTGRKLVGDLERFDWFDQFQKYVPAAIFAAQRSALGAKVNFWMQRPEIVNMKLQKDQFMNLYEQSKSPDPEWARKLNKANAVWHIGWNLPGHIAEVFQPMVSMLPELIAKGSSLPEAFKLTAQAEKDVIKTHGYRLKDKFFNRDKATHKVGNEEFEGLAAIWLKTHGESPQTIDEARMLHEKRGRIQKAPLSELRDFDGTDQERMQDFLDGKKPGRLAELIRRPFHTYAEAAMGFYSNFTQHNGAVALVTAYRKFRKAGLTHAEASQKAELFDLTVNNSGGRLERPEMFGKMGGAGHFVYGLSSFVRGRFAQLATYYRHGFDQTQFKDKLEPGEVAAARKAFQTMILAQVGAAGLLGLPFIGAGIALMEELTGEDIKGKMIGALDEVTNDPMLTRLMTHGMMSTMAEGLGIPADLHSRFALSSFLGTNSYDGMSAKSLMGPSVAMFDSMFKLGSQVAQGEDFGKALAVGGPGGVKRLAEALSEDFQRDNPEADLLTSMMGFRSPQMVKQKEWEQITRKQEFEASRDLEKSAMEIYKAMEESPRSARQRLLVEADKLLPEGLDRTEVIQQRQQNIKDLVQKVSRLAADKVGPEDPRRGLSGRVAPVASQTAQAMGVQMPNPMELARALAQQKTRSQLGQTTSQRPIRNAMLQEMQWDKDPFRF